MHVGGLTSCLSNILRCIYQLVKLTKPSPFPRDLYSHNGSGGITILNLVVQYHLFLSC